MTDSPPDLDQAPTKPDNAPDSLVRRLGLSGSQVAASALAAVSSAVAASYLGVAGTVIGAGVGSVVATVSTALYQHSLARTNERLRQVVPVPARHPAWTKVAAGAAVVFGVALGSIAVFEQVTGGPLASTVRGDDQRGSTLGKLVSPPRRERDVTPKPTPSTTGAPSPSVSPTTPPPVTPTTPPPSTPPTSAPPATPSNPPPSTPPPTTSLTKPPATQPATPAAP